MWRSSTGNQRFLRQRRRQSIRAFAVSELILTATTASIVVGTALTSLTVYMSVTDERKSIPTSDGIPASVLPAEEISMETTLFHLELQKLVHEADLCYVIGGARVAPGSEEDADFVFSPPLNTSALRVLDELHSISHAPDRALSSHVITQLLKQTLPTNFTTTSNELEDYQKRSFTLLTLKSDQTLTSIITLQVKVENTWIILDSNLYQPSGNTWGLSHSYRSATPREVYDALEDSLSFGATHFWVRHDRLTPSESETGNSLWNRYEEGFCRVEFPDNTWDMAHHPSDRPMPSKYTYFIPVVK